MTIDRRLHHAARELRAVPIEVPPLGSPPSRRRPTRILQGLAAPVLFVAGGVFAYGLVQSTSSPAIERDVSEMPVVDTDAPVAETGTPARVATAPSIHAEMELIAELVNRSQKSSTPAPAPIARGDAAPSGEPGMRATESIFPI